MQAERKNGGQDRRYFLFAIRIMGELVWMIAVPVVLLAFLGKWLDNRWNTRPWFLIFGFVLAALISGFAVWRRVHQLGKEYQDID